MTLDAWDMDEIDRYAVSIAHLHHRHAVPRFHRYAMAQGWFMTPAWIPARARFMATWRAARTAMGERQADKKARNEWRAWSHDEWAA